MLSTTASRTSPITKVVVKNKFVYYEKEPPRRRQPVVVFSRYTTASFLKKKQTLLPTKCDTLQCDVSHHIDTRWSPSSLEAPSTPRLPTLWGKTIHTFFPYFGANQIKKPLLTVSLDSGVFRLRVLDIFPHRFIVVMSSERTLVMI